MYDDKYHFITFTLFAGLLSGFGIEIVIPEPDPLRISDLFFRSKPDPFVKDRIGFLGTIYSPSFMSVVIFFCLVYGLHFLCDW